MAEWSLPSLSHQPAIFEPLLSTKHPPYLRRVIQVGQEIGARGFMHSHAELNLELLQRLSDKKETD